MNHFLVDELFLNAPVEFRFRLSWESCKDFSIYIFTTIWICNWKTHATDIYWKGTYFLSKDVILCRWASNELSSEEAGMGKNQIMIWIDLIWFWPQIFDLIWFDFWFDLIWIGFWFDLIWFGPKKFFIWFDFDLGAFFFKSLDFRVISFSGDFKIFRCCWIFVIDFCHRRND